ncbi:MAG: hypothetical protein DI586_05930 [Micavibrio aeruginosavorus]|uniref:DotA/TraY family protein n=1 Tax=Micavibrio aeruginosavorus TaxID=349221 RepID=A0A2W5FPL5_9BACT|nr:MAG: hypothetical protein DI586_05930 [Micavibrio aeruginosavorus]
MKITKGEIAKYVFLPAIVPRLKEFKFDLTWIAYLMALIFAATRILPANHFYTRIDSQGKFGIADIFFEAGRHLKGGLRHIDQYIIYGCFVLGAVLFLGQFAVLLFVILSHTAEAASGFSMFKTPYPEGDLALMMLDKVFEIPNMFGSKFDAAVTGGTTFGMALHGIIAFYNQGMLMIAGLIVLYYIFAVIIETMQTGTPFGQRFQEVFVPIRIVIAIFLLVPLGYGLSAGQLMVLKIADWGSGFATNGWIVFNMKADSNPLGAGAAELVMNPKTEQIEDLLRYYSLVHSCRAIYELQYGKEILPYIIYKDGSSTVSADARSMSFSTARQRFGKDNVKLTYGEYNSGYERFRGKVKPYCGSIDLPGIAGDIESAEVIQDVYWTFLQLLWTNTRLNSYGDRMAQNFLHKSDVTNAGATSDWSDPDGKPDGAFYPNTRNELQAIFNTEMRNAQDYIRTDPAAEMAMTKEMLDLGWGGAGIWFNKIAEYNGAVMSASISMPVPTAYPAALQWLLVQKKTTDNSLSSLTQFTATFGNGAALKDMMSGGGLDNPAKDGQIGKFLGDVYNDMTKENTFGDGSERRDNNVVANMFGMIFGTDGLSELRGNNEIHPLAKMSALGRSILDRAIMYMGGAMVMGGMSGLSSVVDNMFSIDARKGSFQGSFSGMGGMFITFATIGITVGIVLYYVIPFLPFLYFFFGVGRWVKAVFEAVIGIPLWALAHLRIDGEGIPGPAATQGYFLLLEIFLRPILVIFGLMAAVSCFSALAIVLDTLFDLVTTNVSGYNPVDAQGAITFNNVEFKRGHIDQFFYTIVYAVLLYMMAMSCFKLIDLIPNSVLRFIGSGVTEFNDQMNLEQDMVRYTGLATYSMSDDVAAAGMELGKAGGLAVAMPANMAINMGREAESNSAAQQQEMQRQQQEQLQRNQQEQQQRQQQEAQRQQPAAQQPAAPAEKPATAPTAEQVKAAEEQVAKTTDDALKGKTPPRDTPPQPPADGKKT